MNKNINRGLYTVSELSAILRNPVIIIIGGGFFLFLFLVLIIVICLCGNII